MAKPTDLPLWAENETNNIQPPVTYEQEGWQAPGGIPEKPPYQYFNWWQWNVSQWLKELNNRGILEWDSTTTYEIGDLVVGSDGYVYQSNIGTNLNFDPTVSTTQWKLGFRNPTHVIGANLAIDSSPDNLQLQIVDATTAGLELATDQGASRQRLTLLQGVTSGEIQSYDQSTTTPLRLDINPDGGTVDIGSALSVNDFFIDNDLESASATNTINGILSTVATLNITGTIDVGSVLVVYASIFGSVTTGSPTVLSARQATTGSTATFNNRINGSILNRNLSPVLTNEAGTTFAEIYEVTASGTITIIIQAEVDAGSIDNANCGLTAKWIRKKTA